MTSKNPWLGLASYEEPKNDGTDYEFCGRDEETIEMVRLIDNNLFVTLYGCSGIGKTSLLRAGVIPILRKKDYFPLYVRLSQEPKEISYAEAIVRKLQDSGLTVTKSAEVKHHDATERLFLWEYFATTHFLKEGREVYPVIILDQFEEVFREGDKAKAELLLRQIYLLLNDELEMPDEAGWSADTNYRFVASIREDFLFVLEDSIDENSLDLYKNNRYRLRPMKQEQARQVVLMPGKDCIEETEKDAVAERIITLAKRPQSDDIDTLLLSLVCAGTYDKKSGEKIALTDLTLWKNNPMEVYYKDAVKGLTADQIRYIQQHFIRDDGSRRRVEVKEAKAVFGETTYDQLIKGKTRLITIGNKGQVELLHDQLGMAVYEERKAFEEREYKKKKKQRTVLVSFIALTIAGLSFFYFQNNELKIAQWKMMENQARFVAEKASQLVDEGDSYLARLLALEVLPANIEKPFDKPYTLEAESAMRKACYDYKSILRGHTNNVNSADFSPDGKRIVSASDDKTIRIWDAQTGQLLQTMEGHSESVKSAAFSPDGKKIVSASIDKTIRIWNAENGDSLKTLRGHIACVKSAAFSPDSKKIVSASLDNTIRLWDADSGQLLQTLEGHKDNVNSASFSLDGTQIVSASSDNTINIWNAITGQLMQSFEGHTSGVLSAVFSPDGKQIVSASEDNSICIWNAQTGQVIQKVNYTYHVRSATFSPDGKQIVSASWDNTVRLWDAGSGQLLRTLKGHTSDVESASYSYDGKQIVSASCDNTVRIWNTQTERLLQILEGSAISFRSAAISHDCKQIVSASFDNTINIWNAKTGQLMLSFKGHPKSIYSVSLSSSCKQKQIVSASEDSTVCIWDAQSGRLLQRLKGHTTAVRSAFFSPDDKWIVSASFDNTVRIWDAQNGQLMQTLEGHTSSVCYASFSPDGKKIVSASGDKTVRIWDVETGTQLIVLEGHTGWVYSASFSPNGRWIISASDDHTIRIWDSQTGQLMQTLEGHTSSVRYASFSPDGKLIVSVSSDKSICVWDSQTGQHILTLEGHTSAVLYASFSPDGKQILSLSDNKTVRIWDFPPLQQLINETRKRFKDRSLTPEERQKYYLEERPQKVLDYQITSTHRNPI